MKLSPTLIARETARRTRHQELATGEDIHRLRTEAGVSLAALSEATSIHKSHIARIEAGKAHASLRVLTAIGVALGADLSVRYFPGSGPRLHDRFQAAMVETLLRTVHARWRAELEVPILRPSRGVIDVVLTDTLTGAIVVTEVYSELRRIEQQIRWTNEKAEGLRARLHETDPAIQVHDVSKLLILRSTVATRDLARRYQATFAATYPMQSRDAVRALTTASTPWPGPAVVWMCQEGGSTTLMAYPPPTVALGRGRPVSPGKRHLSP